MKKRGQTEIIGLAIVVLLLVVAFTFVIRFMINDQPSTIRQDFVQSELSSNTINSFLQLTSRDCNGLSMTQLIQNCAESNSIICETGQLACDYVEDTALEIFEETFVLWNMPYDFTIYRSNEPPLIALGEVCPGDKKSKLWPVPLSFGTVFVQLDLCN